MTHLLLIDDDQALSNLLAEYLRNDGFAVTTAATGAAALTLCRQQQFDLLILDVMMPVMDGIAVLTQLRRFSSVPVIMLTARGEGMDKVIGLELGADDYVAKPCLPRELVARVKAILRRTAQSNQHSLQFGALSINPASRSASIDQQKLSMTGAEFSLLYLLAQRAGQIISKTELSEQALGKPLGPYDRSIDVHICHIRQKLGSTHWISAIRGKGYQFTDISTLEGPG